MTHRLGLLPVLVLASVGNPLFAQRETHWVFPTTLGYGALGCGAGYLVATEAIKEAENFAYNPARAVSMASGCFLGFKVGHGLGSEADSLLAEGETLATGQRRGVQLGTVLTGAALGTLVAFIPAAQEDGRKAEVVATGALLGAAGGLLVQIMNNAGLYPASPPEMSLGVGPGGRVTFGAGLRFRSLNPLAARSAWDSRRPRGAPGRCR